MLSALPHLAQPSARMATSVMHASTPTSITLSCSSLCCVRKQLVMCAAQVRPQKNSRREGDTDYSVSVQQKGPSGLMTPYAPSPWPFVWCGLCSLPASHWSCRLLFLICRSLTCTPPSVWLRAILPLSAPPVSVCLVWLNTHTNCSRDAEHSPRPDSGFGRGDAGPRRAAPRHMRCRPHRFIASHMSDVAYSCTGLSGHRGTVARVALAAAACWTYHTFDGSGTEEKALVQL